MLSTSFYKGFKAACFTVAAVASFGQAQISLFREHVLFISSRKRCHRFFRQPWQKPLLVQSWIDDGRDDTNPQELKLPFIITPPVSRIDPQKVNPFGSRTGVVHCRKIANPILVQCARDSTEVKSERR